MTLEFLKIAPLEALRLINFILPLSLVDAGTLKQIAANTSSAIAGVRIVADMIRLMSAKKVTYGLVSQKSFLL